MTTVFIWVVVVLFALQGAKNLLRTAISEFPLQVTYEQWMPPVSAVIYTALAVWGASILL